MRLPSRFRGDVSDPAGVHAFNGRLERKAAEALAAAVASIIARAPLFTPTMPRTGRPFSVRMTNCGPLGWVSDRTGGYRYQPTHPVTGRRWPAMPEMLLGIWEKYAGYPHPPEACLINIYSETAKMGLHRDEDEADFAAPVVSISLGDDCRFRVGGSERGGPTQSFRLKSGDIVVLGGESRLAYHGVDRIYPGTSALKLPQGNRINLTLRRVSAPNGAKASLP